MLLEIVFLFLNFIFIFYLCMKIQLIFVYGPCAMLPWWIYLLFPWDFLVYAIILYANYCMEVIILSYAFIFIILLYYGIMYIILLYYLMINFCQFCQMLSLLLLVSLYTFPH